ncbi:MAG: DnaJ family molecular chaperone [Bauldia sp.]|nr:DnaJ family molecular chaperone [Bauldia sp.]
MAVWSRMRRFLGAPASVMSAIIERLGVWIGGDPMERRQVAFSIAIIALSAKMAKADGVVTLDEVAAFRRLVEMPPGEARNVERLFDLARRDVAGFEAYAARIAALYAPGDPMLSDIIDGLFEIAKADTMIHEAEIAYLAAVAERFGLDEDDFERIRLRHVVPEDGDPYVILGVSRALGFPELRRHYLGLVAEHHPDRLVARGVPPEFVAIANQRLAVINVAWARIEHERRPQDATA